MWDAKFLGVTVYDLLNWFFIYSFLGWLFESTFVSIKMKKLINRGFVTLPFCTIYAVGALSVYLFLRPFSEDMLILYFTGALLATFIEYLTSVLMENLFHTSWWDYSMKKFNFQGRICLGSSIVWGFFSMIVFKVFQPFVEFIVSLYPVKAGKIVISVILVLYGADFVIAAVTAFGLKQKLLRMDEVINEIFENIQESKLSVTAEELKSRLQEYRESYNKNPMRLRLEDLKERSRKLLMTAGGETGHPYKEELTQKITKLHEKYAELRTKNRFLYDRMFKAYPNLKSKNQALGDRLRNKLKNKNEERG